MKKLIIGGAVFVSAVAVLRRFGPALAERVMSKCEAMFDRMPEDFPPKRMMRGIDEIREQNARILRNLDEERPVTAVASGRR